MTTTNKPELTDFSELIRQLEEAGFEVRASEFADAPTMVFGNLDNAIEFRRRAAEAPAPSEPANTEKVKRLAMELAHVYSFVRDDTVPRKRDELFAAIDALAGPLSQPSKIPDELPKTEAELYLQGYEDGLASAAFYVSHHLMHGDEHADIILELARPKITVRDDGVRQPSIPEGYALVPIKMTPAMRAAWDKAPSSEDIDEEIRLLYGAILDAAPALPAAQLPKE